jgi:hypothetical protein
MHIKPEALEPVLLKMASAGMIRRGSGQRKRAGKAPDVWFVV